MLRRGRPTGYPWRLPLALFATVLVLGVSTGGAQADWTAQNGNAQNGNAQSWTAQSVPLGGVSVNAATASVAASGTGALATSYKFTTATAGTANLAIAPLTFSNTGSSPLSLTTAISSSNATLAAKIALTFWTGASCGSTIPAAGTTVGTLAAPPALPASFSSVAAGASVLLCAATRLSGTVAASQGETTTATLVLTGRVGTAWSSSSTPPTFTQNVYRVGDPTAITCTPGLLGAVTLSWTAPTGVGAGATSYRIVKTNSPTTVVKSGITGTSTGVGALDLGLDSLTGTGPLPISVQAVDATYGTISAGTSIATSYSVALPLLTIRCPA